MLLKLDDFAPTKSENDVLFDAVHPWHEQVAIGYLRAWRHANGGKRSDSRHQPNIGDLFSGMFNQEDSR